MIDLHTHILCNMDDGAKTPEESLQLLKMERDSGVSTVVLTPHFYRDKARPEHFFGAREKAMGMLNGLLDSLSPAERESLPRVIPAAEVTWWPSIAQCEELEAFCIPGTRNMLLELPFAPWDKALCNQLYTLVNCTGITPVLAHTERYLSLQDPGQVAEVLSLGLPVQITAEQFLHLSTRRNAVKALQSWAHVVATDCHDTQNRKPVLGQAMEFIGKKLGRETVADITAMTASLLGES